VIAVDTNILVHAHRGESPWHESADRVMAGFVEGRSSWVIPWHCIIEFIAMVTHPRIYQPPSHLHVALEQVQSWLESPSLILLSETPGFYSTLATTLSQAAVVGPRVHDARIAALCIHHGVTTLYTADRDFSRFARLHTQNPLVAPR